MITEGVWDMITNTLKTAAFPRVLFYIMGIVVLFDFIILNTVIEAEIIRCSSVSACENNKTDYLVR